MTRHAAFTLLELMVALASASVLMVGLSSALYIAAQGMDLNQGASASRGRANAAMGRLLGDARTATRYRSVTPTAVEFDVADRTGDGVADKLRYAWNGVAGGPLRRSLNGGSPVTLLHDVRSLTFGAPTRAVAASNVTTTALNLRPTLGVGPAPTGLVSGRSLVLSRPPSTAPGDLLVAVVATTNNQTNYLGASGWTSLVAVNNGSKVTLTVWLRTVAAGEPATYTWTWATNQSAIGWILPLYNQRATAPVAASEYATAVGKSQFPATPSVNAATNNSLLLRVGAFEKDSFTTNDVTGLPGHVNLWARNVGSSLAAACGYRASVTSGATGAAAFSLKSNNDYAVATIVITPRTPVGQ